MGTVRLTVAQALVRFLDNQYLEFDGKRTKFVKGVFTVFGHGNVLGMGQALEECAGDLVVHQGRNEQGMAHAATAFAKQMHRKQIYACTTSVGPGAANMVTAAATATANNIPVLLLPGDVFSTRQPDPVLQQIEQLHNLSMSTNDAFRAVSKYWDRVSRPEQLMSAMINAMRVLTDPADTGAVTVALPQDVQGEVFDFPDYFLAPRVHRLERTPATTAMIAEAVERLKQCERPLVICGGGVRYSEAAPALLRFLEAFGIPMAETQAGKSAVPFQHPLNLGGVGVTGGLAANRIAKKADLIIGIGTRYTDFTTASKGMFDEHVHYININTSRFHAGKMDAVSVVADAGMALEQLTQALTEQGYHAGWKEEVRLAKEEWQTELDRLFAATYTGPGFVPEVAGQLDDKLEEYHDKLKTSLTQTEVLGALQQLIPENAIVVGASGSLPGDMQRVWCQKVPNTYHMEYGYSCMGYEISGALGVKLAAPQQEVYAMTGDGSFLMLHSELLTSLQEKKKITIMLLDNNGFGCINNLQMGNGMGSFGTEFRERNAQTGQLDGELVLVDYAKVAAGYGCKTYTVHTLAELRDAVQDALKQEQSVLIDVKVLPKTMTSGYESWWHVGVAGVSEKESIHQAYLEKEAGRLKARLY